MVISSLCRAQVHPSLSHLAAPLRPLTLPWLAPAQVRWLSQRRDLYATRGIIRRRYSRSRQHLSKHQSRRVGSLHGIETASADGMFSPEFFARALGSGAGEQRPVWEFGQMYQRAANDNRSPFITMEGDGKPRGLYKLEATTHGPAADLLRHLDTSLRVGRLDRAQSILSRLLKSHFSEEETVSEAYTLFIEATLAAMLQSPARSGSAQETFRNMQALHKEEVERRHVPVTAPILIAMIRAAIHALHEQESDRVVRDYITTASSIGEHVFEEVLFSDTYTDQEYDYVGNIISDAKIDLPTPRVEGEAIEDIPAASPPSQPRVLWRKAALDLTKFDNVLGTPLTGRGLQGVQESLSPLQDLPALSGEASPEAQLARNKERQRLLEELAVDVAIRRWREEDEQLKKIGINTALQSKPMGALMWQWYTALIPELEAELEICRTLPHSLSSTDQLENDRQHYGMYMELLPIHQIAATTILYTCGKMTLRRDDEDNVETKLTSLCTGLAKQVEAEVNISIANTSRASSASKSLSQRRRPNSLSQAAQAASIRPLTGSSASVRQDEYKAWPKIVKVKFGAMLVQKLISVAKLPVTRRHPRTKERVTQMQPAFFANSRYEKGRRTGYLASNAAYVTKLKSEPMKSLLAKQLPMVVEPRPWTGFSEGGYTYSSYDIMRTNGSEDGCKDYFQAAAKRGDLQEVFDGLNALGRVPWHINHDVFKAQLEAWNTGQAIANLAPLDPNYPLPPAPDASAGLEARKRWLMEVRTIENKKSGDFSVRCFQNFQMEVARAMANETMYFPHNLDFRGRAYPMPPYLNHMGADNARALLVFADGKELGVEGLRWLKIHLANVAGYDKASLQEREDFTMAHLKQIRESARTPFEGERWWLKSEDAWQTLAACCELTNALDCPDPTKFISHLPIHQDGTCNGLQHYAALGGDTAGAMHVNLEPGDRPADVYSGVAAGVAEEVEADAAAGHPVAKILSGRISRKVVKQPVMTNVYGVTRYGARAQVRKQIEDIFPEVNQFADVNHGVLSGYVVGKIFKKLGSMFTGAQAIQRWLEECADRISMCLLPEQVEKLVTQYNSKYPDPVKSAKQSKVKSQKSKSAEQKGTELAKTSKAVAGDSKGTAPLFKTTVVWTTPLRLPVVQPYRSTFARHVKSQLATLLIHEPRLWDPVNKRKQLQAFPPNFIHSLDATHMLISAKKCADNGLTFASVHDSFWTHACDVGTMSHILRDAFVAMHSEDIIGRVSEEFQTRYKKCLWQDQVGSDNAAHKEIIAWRKTNKRPQQEMYELKLEHQRMRLLSSDKASDRIAGAKMVTPASILETTEPVTARQQDPVSLQSAVNGSDKMTTGQAQDNEDNNDLGPFAPTMISIAKSSGVKLTVWRPLLFPKVPEKGLFDVRRLRESKYFFH